MSFIIYDLLYMIPIYISCVLLGINQEILPQKGMVVCIVALFCICAIVCFFNIKTKLKLLIPGVIFASTAGIILIVKPENRSEFVLEYLWIVWLFLLAIIIFALGKLSLKNSWVRRGFGVIIIFTLIAVMYHKVAISKLIVICLFFELLVYLSDEIQRSWKKSGGVSNTHHLVYITPFLVLISVCLYIIPANDKPYDWKIVIDSWEKVVDTAKTIYTILPGKNDESAKVGFSDKAMMRGVIQRYPKELMKLRPDKNTGNVVYLSGKAFDKFDGREWISTVHTPKNTQIMDAIEIQSAVALREDSDKSDFFKKSRINIRYELFNTRYLFTPPKAENKPDIDQCVSYVDYSDSLFADKRIKYGTEYNIHFYRLNNDAKIMNSLISDKSKIDEDTWNKYRSKYFFKQDEKDCSYNDYIEYREMIKDNYSEEIVLSKELQDKMDEVLEGATNDYEKLLRIEEWLSSFTYTTTPGNIPDWVQTPSEFLDYFMLEKQEGYCMHYATAFTLLARANGMSAKFVQGLFVKCKGSQTVMVTADDAHAWPEVYFEDIGWIIFEPTPKYNKSISWNNQDVNIDDYAKRYEEYYKKTADSDYDLADEEGSEEVSVDEENADINIYVIVIPILCVILFLAVFLIIYRAVVIAKYNAFDISKKIMVKSRMNLLILLYLGLPLKDGQTLEELGKEITHKYGDKSAMFIEAYERLLYAGDGFDSKFDATGAIDDDLVSKFDVSDSIDDALASTGEDSLSVVDISLVELMGILDEKKKYLKVVYRVILSLQYTVFVFGAS